MTDEDKPRFRELMLGVAENFSAQISTPGLRMQFAALKQFTIEQVEAAAMKLVTTRTVMGMPTIAEFYEAINGSQVNKAKEQAHVQVAEVLGQIRRVGVYGTPCFSDPITRELLNTRWTFRSLCGMTEAEMKWWAKEFIEAYQAYSNVRLAVGMDDMGYGQIEFNQNLVEESC